MAELDVRAMMSFGKKNVQKIKPEAKAEEPVEVLPQKAEESVVVEESKIVEQPKVIKKVIEEPIDTEKPKVIKQEQPSTNYPVSSPTNLMHIPKVQKTYKNETTAVIDYLPEAFDVLGTKARQVARPDLPVNFYIPRYKEGKDGSEKVVDKSKGNFDLYNFDLNDKLSRFSDENQDAGGVAITRSQITEACLDFVFYDLELRPDGFKSTEDVRNYLRSLMK